MGEVAIGPDTGGSLVENFVLADLRKQATWSEMRVELFHFRTKTDQEVDIVIENEAGEIVGIEVKASADVGANDLRASALYRRRLAGNSDAA